MFCDKENRDLSSDIYRVSFDEFPKICWTVKHICALPSACWLKNLIRPNLIEEENTKSQIEGKQPWKPLFFQLLNDWQETFHKLWNFCEISLKQIEENHRESHIVTGERLPSWSLNLITNIILLIFTTANNTPHLASHLLMTFSDLEKPKDQNFLEKHDTSARAKIEQKPHGAS